MMRLYQFATSPLCAKLRKILDFKGVDFELVEVDYIQRHELVLASGQMTVPALTLESGETLVDSERIALALEEGYPEPTIFPPGWRGIHLALARYFESELEDALFRAAVPAELAYFRRRGPDHAALWCLIRERKYGAGFVEQMSREHEARSRLAHDLLAPLEQSLGDRGFLLGRIGYADFALYGQLALLAIGGGLRNADEMPNLQAFFQRIDRISSVLDPNV